MVNPGGNYFDLAQIPNGGCNLNCCIKIFDTPMSSIGPTPILALDRLSTKKGFKQRERFLINSLSIYSYLKHILDKLLKNLFFV